MKTGWVWDVRSSWYDTGRGPGVFPPGQFVEPGEHMDNPATRERVASLVSASGLESNLSAIASVLATDEELLAVHTASYLEYLEEQNALPKGGYADRGINRTPFAKGDLAIAKLSAGGVVAAAKAVVTGEVGNAYALVRPPGHHALPDTGLGFCVFANIAIAIQAARKEQNIRRIAVVDWDVHHGNGTQSIFWDDSDVLTISVHQDRLLRSSIGAVEEDGGPNARGACLNVPLPPGSGSGAYREAFTKLILPAVRGFRPDLIVVASGYDASYYDPNGRMLLGSNDYRWMTEQLMEVAADTCADRLLVVHEGGYSAFYVPFCALAVVETLSAIQTDADDPSAEIIAANPYQELQENQARAIRAAVEHTKMN